MKIIVRCCLFIVSCSDCWLLTPTASSEKWRDSLLSFGACCMLLAPAWWLRHKRCLMEGPGEHWCQPLRYMSRSHVNNIPALRLHGELQKSLSFLGSSGESWEIHCNKCVCCKHFNFYFQILAHGQVACQWIMDSRQHPLRWFYIILCSLQREKIYSFDVFCVENQLNELCIIFLCNFWLASSPGSHHVAWYLPVMWLNDQSELRTCHCHHRTWAKPRFSLPSKRTPLGKGIIKSILSSINKNWPLCTLNPHPITRLNEQHLPISPSTKLSTIVPCGLSLTALIMIP